MLFYYMQKYWLFLDQKFSRAIWYTKLGLTNNEIINSPISHEAVSNFKKRSIKLHFSHWPPIQVEMIYISMKDQGRWDINGYFLPKKFWPVWSIRNSSIANQTITATPKKKKKNKKNQKIKKNKKTFKQTTTKNPTICLSILVRLTLLITNFI